MIVLDYKDRRPIYEQVMERLQELMIMGVLQQDEKLPSVRGLATELSINPNTIQRAYMELEQQGYIYSVKGKGSFAADVSRIKDAKWMELEAGLKEMAEKAVRLGAGAEDFARLAREAYRKAGESV